MGRKLDEGYVTLDGSRVVELLHPDGGGPETYSVALAIVGPGETTRLHRHRTSGEVYYFLEGEAEVQVGEEAAAVGPDDAVVIPAGQAHRIVAEGDAEVHLLCVCRPPYRHEDTVVAERDGDGD